MAEQRQFLSGDGYQVGDSVEIGNKMWRIKQIVKDVATLTYYGIGGEEKITRKLASLPIKPVTVTVPQYKADQKLDNGWKVRRITVKDKYLVDTGYDTVEMHAQDIAQAERDYRNKLLDAVINTPAPDESVDDLFDGESEDKIHADAEKFARRALEKEHSVSPAPALTPIARRHGDSPSPKGRGEPADPPIPKVGELPSEEEMQGVLDSLVDLEKTIAMIDKRLATIDEMQKQIADYGNRLDALENTPVASPTPESTDRVMVKTLTGDVGMAFDVQMASYIADGWDVLYQGLDGNKWTVMLKKEKQIELDKSTSISLVDAVSRSRVPKTVNGTALTPDPSPKGRGGYMEDKAVITPEGFRLTGMARDLYLRGNQELLDNTCRMMGDVS